MTNYYRVALGRKRVYAQVAKDGNYIGVDFLPDIDLSGKLDENWRDFNKEMIPVCLQQNPGKTRADAGKKTELYPYNETSVISSEKAQI